MLIATTDNERALAIVAAHRAVESVSPVDTEAIRARFRTDVPAELAAEDISRRLVLAGLAIRRFEPTRAPLEQTFLDSPHRVEQASMTPTAISTDVTRAPSSSVARLVDAEYLKLRKRRGLVTSALVLTVVPVTTVHVVLAILHWQDPHSTEPSGGVENFAGTVGALGLFSVVAAILVGATLGTGDLDAGVFRRTGHHRTFPPPPPSPHGYRPDWRSYCRSSASDW